MNSRQTLQPGKTLKCHFDSDSFVFPPIFKFSSKVFAKLPFRLSLNICCDRENPLLTSFSHGLLYNEVLKYGAGSWFSATVWLCITTPTEISATRSNKWPSSNETSGCSCQCTISVISTKLTFQTGGTRLVPLLPLSNLEDEKKTYPGHENAMKMTAIH